MKDESMRSNSETSVGHVESQFIFWHGCAACKLGKKRLRLHIDYMFEAYIHIYICIHSHNIRALNIYTHACIRIHAHNHIYIVQIKFCLCALNTCTHRQTHTPAYARTHTHDHASILQIKFCLGTTEQSNLDFWNKSSNFSQIAKIHACMITLLWDQLLYADGFKIWNKTPYRFDLWRYVCLMRSCYLLHCEFANCTPIYLCRYHAGKAYIIDVSQSVEHDHPNSMAFLRKDCTNITGLCLLITWLLCLYLAVHLDITVLVDWV